MGEESLEHGRFGTNAARAAQFHASHFEQAHAAMQDAEPFRDVVHARVEGEESADRAGFGAGPFFDERVHFGDGLQFLRAIPSGKPNAPARHGDGSASTASTWRPMSA
ncbi:MAG: hypothetical protein MZV64_35045 [Ignavibacteriales bacterium]|nr:hypothetical protein [Ignavibacteriales bacterium]